MDPHVRRNLGHAPHVDRTPDRSRRAFLVREAVGREHGEKYYAHPRWARPFHGVRVRADASRDVMAPWSSSAPSLAPYLRIIGPDPPAAVPPETHSDRALHYVPRLRPGEHFSHATALALLDCPVRVPKGMPVHVSAPIESCRVRCKGVIGHRHAPAASVIGMRMRGSVVAIPVSAPLDAVLQSASMLPFIELVVALDHLLLRSTTSSDAAFRVTRDELAAYTASAAGRGVVRFREAAALAREGAESRMETLMRLASVRVGMPELTLQANLRDEHGRWIGRFDAIDDETRSIFEYDGEQHHFSLRQRRRDPKKLQTARDANWRVLVCYQEDVREGLLVLGRRMLSFCGRPERSVRPRLARLLDETSGDDTESAVPYGQRPVEWSIPSRTPSRTDDI